MVVSVALAVVTLAARRHCRLLRTRGARRLVRRSTRRPSDADVPDGRRSELQNAVALNSGLFNASRVVGPALAGLVIAAADTGVCFVVNAMSFLGAVALYLIRERAVPGREAARDAGRRRDPRGPRVGGATPPRANRALRGDGRQHGGLQLQRARPVLASQTLHAGAATFGFFRPPSSRGAPRRARHGGALRRRVRALSSPARPDQPRHVRLAFADGSTWRSFSACCSSCSFSLFTSSANALVQLASAAAPARLVIGRSRSAFAGLAPIGGLVAGFLAEQGGTELAFGLAGVAGLLAIAWAAYSLFSSLCGPPGSRRDGTAPLRYGSCRHRTDVTPPPPRHPGRAMPNSAARQLVDDVSQSGPSPLRGEASPDRPARRATLLQ